MEIKQRIKRKSIINRKELKSYILEMTKILRPGWDCRQISASSLDDFEAFFKHKIRDIVKRHPTKGKTFKEVF